MLLRCEAMTQDGKRCGFAVCGLPGFRVSRRLEPGEKAAEGAGFVICPNIRCRCKYEVVRSEEMAA